MFIPDDILTLNSRRSGAKMWTIDRYRRFLALRCEIRRIIRASSFDATTRAIANRIPEE